MTSTVGSAAPIAQYGVADDYMALLRGQSVVSQLRERGMLTVPARTMVPRELDTGTGAAWLAAGSVVPVVSNAFSTVSQDIYAFGVASVEADQHAANLSDAIAKGGNIPALVSRLQDVERTRQALMADVNELPAEPMAYRVGWPAMERQARRLLADWRGLLGRHGQDAREALRAMLEGPVRFTPISEDGRQGYQFQGNVSIGEILAGKVW